YNIGTFAMPYLQSFLGNTGTIVACIFDAGNALMCTGLTYAFAAGFCGKTVERGPGAFVRRLFSSVPFDAYAGMLILYVLDVHLPGPVSRVAAAFGSGNAFLAMFMIGLAFELKLNREKLGEVAKAILIRFGCAALFALGIFYLTPWPAAVRQTLALIVFAPVSAMTVINTQRCGGDTEKAGLISSLSILAGIVIITALVIG
ncbi:MAG: AEC family transporter, partial [Clostridium sp.]|nr:AEC family transporter [Clostridium sp.]